MALKETKSLLQEKNDEVIHSFCPYRVCPLGAHVDHQLGLVTGFALDKGTHFDYIPTDDGFVDVYSENFEGAAIGNINTDYERQYIWADYLFGAIDTLKKSYSLKKGLRGIVSGSLLGGWYFFFCLSHSYISDFSM